MKMTSHAFVSRKVAGYLEKLHTKQHRNPGKLGGCPNREDNSEAVFVEDFAEIIGEDVAFDVLW